MRLTSTYSFALLVLSFFVAFVHGQSSSGSSSGVSSSVTGTSTGSGSLSSNVSSSTSSAEYPSLSGYSTCVTNCLALAASARGCISVTQTDCYCNRTNAANFKRDIVSCVQGGCATELAGAEQLAQGFCAVGNSSTSLSFPPITSSSSSMSSTSLPPSSSSSVPPSSVSSAGPSSSSGSDSGGALGAHGEITTSLMFGSGVGLISVLIAVFV